jgi:hypothetical protein
VATSKKTVKRAAVRGSKPASATKRSKPTTPATGAEEASTVDEALARDLAKALAKINVDAATPFIVRARSLPPAARASTFAAAIAAKKKDSAPIAIVRALAALGDRASKASVRARLANKALDEMRSAGSWVYIELSDEVLALAEAAGAARLDRALTFFESADLTIDGLIPRLIARSRARGEAPGALELLAEHAASLAPLARTIADDAAPGKEKARALAEASKLEGDALFVFDQLLCGQVKHDNEHTWRSLSRLLVADESREVHPTALRSALAALRYTEGSADALAKLAEKPAARARLSSVLVDATPENALELALGALRAHAGSSSVFAKVAAAFENPGHLAGELSSEWFRSKSEGAWGFVDDAQAAAVIDGMIRAKKADISQAHHALFYVSHKGCEPRIRLELDRILAEPKNTKLDEELYWSLVFALGHIGTDSAVDYVRTLAFDSVDEGVWECCSVLGETLTEARFSAHIDAAKARSDAGRALSVLSAMVSDFVEKGALASQKDHLLVQLGRAATEVPPRGEWERYRAQVILEGIAAALRRIDPATVVDLTAGLALEKEPTFSKTPTKSMAAVAARWLPKVRSRFHELRKSAYEHPFVGESGDKLLSRWAEALDGRMARRIASAKTATIEGKLTDDKLSAAAGSSLRERVIATDDEAWFVAEDDRLHVVGRKGVLCDSTLLASVTDLPGPALDPRATALDERAILWSKGAAAFIEAQRYGASLFIARGKNNGWPDRYVLRFANEEASARALGVLRANPPKDYALAEDPWHVEGHGGVAREYYFRKPGSDDLDYDSFSVTGHDDEAARRAEVEREEARMMRDGGTLKSVECNERLQRLRDRSVGDWLEARARDDSKDALWHLRALEDARRAIAVVGLGPAIDVTIGAPASDDEIAALAEVASVPPGLEALWREVGSASFRVGDRRAELLSPREALARHGAWLAEIDRRKLGDGRLRTTLPLIVCVDKGEPRVVTVFDGAATGGGPRQFTNVESALWWEESLAWMIATGLLSLFSESILEAEPALMVACFGAKAREVERVSLASGDKRWRTVRVDRAVGVWYGKEGSRGKFERALHEDDARAKKAVESAVRAKRKGGYADAT